jgi:hypothetical protein
MNNRIIKNYQQHNKIIGMVIFLIMDIALNSVLDYDKINDHIANNIKLGIFGLQVVIQISIFLILFLATADTFLFRVGLINILIHTIRFTLLIHPIYTILTIAVGAYRVQRLSQGSWILSRLWKDQTFVVLSIIQKICKSTLRV